MGVYLKKRLEEWRKPEKDKLFKDVIAIKCCNEENDKVQYTFVLSKRNVQFLEEAIKDYHLKNELELALIKLRNKIHNSATTKGVVCRE